MSLSVIGPSQAAPAVAAQRPVSAPVAAPSQPASLAPDSVSISEAGHAANTSGDVDRDGDSH